MKKGVLRYDERWERFDAVFTNGDRREIKTGMQIEVQFRGRWLRVEVVEHRGHWNTTCVNATLCDGLAVRV